MAARSAFLIDGQQVEAPDLNSLGDAASVLSGEAITAIVGGGDANVDAAPLTAVPGGGLSVTVGSLGQRVLVQGRLADYLPATTVPIAAATNADRLDLIAFAYSDVIVPTGATARVMDPYGNINPAVATSWVYRGITLTVVTGTPGAGLPAAPSGFDPLAQVHVAAGATVLAAGDITLLLPTIASELIARLSFGLVTSVNGKVGPIALDPQAGITIDNTGPDVKIGNGGVLSLNGQTGAQKIKADSANVTVSTHGDSVGIAVSASAAAGVQSITSADGSIAVVPGTGGAVDLSARPNGSTAGFQAGIVRYVLAVNYGTAITTPIASAGYGIHGSVLGSIFLIVLGGSGGFGAGQGGTAEAHFKLRVKAGAGAQTISGQTPQNPAANDTASVFFDNVLKATTSSAAVLAWSVTVPDDGALHTLVLHLHCTGCPTGAQWSAWIPDDGHGGVDMTKFAYVGP
jgi:hypothetical protein